MSADRPRILLIEDESPIRGFLRITLTHLQFDLIEATTGADGLIKAAENPPDAVILDLGLPDLDGMQVLRRLREWLTVPIIILTARGQEPEKVAALDAGADDYVTKPFGAQELVARVRAAIRRARQSVPTLESGEFRVGQLRMDFVRRRVFVGETQVHLTPIEYRLLTTLVQHAGKVLTHQQLLKAVWGPGTGQETHYVRVYMGQLRRKLEANPADPVYLLTEPGVGYRIVEESTTD